MIRRPPRSTLFPSTPLSRSDAQDVLGARRGQSLARREPRDRLVLAEVLHAAALLPVGHARVEHDHRDPGGPGRSEEHTSELKSHLNLVCRLLLEKNKTKSHV